MPESPSENENEDTGEALFGAAGVEDAPVASVLLFPTPEWRVDSRFADPTRPILPGDVINVPLAVPDAGVALFEPSPSPTAPTSSGKPRAKASSRQSQGKPRTREPQTAEGRRAAEIAQAYADRQPLCSKRRVTDAIETALGAGIWTEVEVVAAVDRLVDSPYGVTENSLRYQLAKAPQPVREVDPVIHRAVGAALEHLGRLDSETMTETELVLAAAIRQLAVAVMHKAAEAP